MRGDEFFRMMATRRPFSRMHPRVAEFFKEYLAHEKVARFGDRFILNMHFPPYPGPAFDAFRGRMLELYADFTGTTVAQVSLTRKMMQTIKLGVHSGMTFEKGIFAIIRSLMYLDGMVLRCKPDAVLLRDMRRFIGEFEKMV